MKRKIEKTIKAIWICSEHKNEDSLIFQEKIPIKERIKKLPVLGKIMWVIYGIFKAPERISHIFAEIENINFQLARERERFQKFSQDLNSNIKEISEQVEILDQRTNFLYEDLSFRYKLLPEDVMLEINSDEGGNLSDEEVFYERFEKKFRGEIKEKLKKYVPLIKEVWEEKKKEESFFLDIGFGDGQFLELLEDEGVCVKGVEINDVYVKRFQEKGFDVICKDAIEYLFELEENFIFGVSAIQVIEHLDFSEVKRLISAVYEKLIPGGIIIIETVNPKSSIALSNFYIDFTHKRPYPYELITFMCSSLGFKNIKVIFSTPVEKHFRTGVVESDYMDYAVVAYKEER